MTYRVLLSQDSQEGSAFSVLLPRGESLLLVAADEGGEIQVGTGQRTSRQRHAVAGGHTLLILAGTRPVQVWSNGCWACPAGSESTRLLAFHDHAMNLQRPLPEDGRLPVTLEAPCDLSDPVAARQWLTAQLLDEGAALRVAASTWAVREAYQLVRFVLEHPEMGVQQLADRYGLSVAQFRRIGRKAFGRSLKEQLRLLRAGRVLHRYADTGHTFTRLSSDFGFSSPSHFCSEIKALLGRSPSSIFQQVNAP